MQILYIYIVDITQTRKFFNILWDVSNFVATTINQYLSMYTFILIQTK